MKVMVKLRYQRHSSKKIRPYARIFQGSGLNNAIDSSGIIGADSARILNKAFRMAKAAAVQKELDDNKLVISQVYATEGPKIKRIRANARGRTNRYQKHLSHITVVVEERELAISKNNKKSNKSTETEALKLAKISKKPALSAKSSKQKPTVTKKSGLGVKNGTKK